MDLNDLREGDRIELHPSTDLWMHGARYGDVTSVGRSKISVKMDRIVRVIRVSPANILRVIDRPPLFVDISTITEYGLTQKLSNAIRCFSVVATLMLLLASSAEARSSGGSHHAYGSYGGSHGRGHR